MRVVAHRRWTRFASRFRRVSWFDDPLQDLADHAVTAQATALALPFLVILGRRDRFYDCEKTFARYSAVGDRVEVVEGAGHSPFLERPGEVARLLREFSGS
ncbi:alpha/beta fold hydrolase [Amycolatopsis sp. lyj-108]|uniref:alpha/beta fold hydrolase n=1 Tax=Amycolatopsis sp. lyj-108 TaxID=2789286 RepID=UPI00397CD051